MAKPENSFIKHLHDHYVQCYSMKNHNEYNGGIFDCWYSGAGKNSRDLWVEYKFIVVPVRDTTVIVPDLSQLQLDWGTARAAEGRNVRVVIGCKAGGVILTQPQWRGLTTEAFRAALISRRELGEFIDNFVSP